MASSFFASFIRSCNEASPAFCVGLDFFPDAAFLVAGFFGDPVLGALALLLALVDDLAFIRRFRLHYIPMKHKDVRHWRKDGRLEACRSAICVRCELHSTKSASMSD
jgi:hypothetical protein